MWIADLIREIRYGLENLWRWKGLIWKDRDWDWAYLYQLMEFKLQRMAKMQREYGIGLGREQLAEEMEEAAMLLKRLYEDDYYDGYYNYQGEYQACLARRAADLKRFCQLFEERSEGWWD